jgi:Tfp pilus assembly protein FimT
MERNWFSRLLDHAGYTAVEAMVVVAGIGIVTAYAAPSVSHFKAAHEVYSATWQVGGMLQSVRARAGAEATPYIVLFQKEEVDDGARTPFALIVRDTDHSYSVTPADEVETYSLGADVSAGVRQYGVADLELIYPDLPPVFIDRYAVFASAAVPSTSTSDSSPVAAPVNQKAKKLKSKKSKGLVGGLVGGVTDLVGGLLGGSTGSGGSGSASTGTGASSTDSSETEVLTVQEIATNGTTFEISETEGVPALIFNERGIPVSPETPREWGTGSGAVYLTDNVRVVYAAVVSPLGEIGVVQYDALDNAWK